MLGKIENNLSRNQITVTRLGKICDRLIPYITDTHTDLIHPTHKTKEQRKMKSYKKKSKTKPPKRY